MEEQGVMVHQRSTTNRSSSQARDFQSGDRVICTPDQRLRVFVSSTLKEMAAEREAARRAISRLRLAPVMFELGARPHPARDLYRAYLAQSHIFIGIYGEQYGWIAPDMEISGLEDESCLAGEKPRLIYIRKPAPNREPRLQELLQSIRDQDSLSYKYFVTPEELEELIEGDLALLLTERFETSQGVEDGIVAGSRPGNLPIPPTPLLGREEEVRRARELLSDYAVWLVTLTGPGGSGKTRLSLEVAGELQEQFEQVWFVELSPLTDPEPVASAIGQTLGVREAGSRSPEAQLIDHVETREWLLILDNFEQVSEAAPLVARLLAQCPGLKVLVTSRMALRLRGEMELAVPPLPVPRLLETGQTDDLACNASVALFCQRARSINPDFLLTEKNALTLAEICRRLDGLPLAIELAAARIRLLTPQAMLSRLDQRLPVLAGGARDLPHRQRTMRDTIAWSYDLLDPAAARLFRRMAVFVGGCTLASLEAVCNTDSMVGPEVLDALEALLEKNLVRRSQDPSGEPRFDMLETIREFALEGLEASGERWGIEQLHADYFVDLAESAEPYYRSGERDPWLGRVETEIANLRAVFDRTAGRQIASDTGLRLVGSLGWFCHLRGHLAEGRRWAETMLTQRGPAEPPALRAKALFPAGGLAWSQSDYRAAVRRLEESASLFRELNDTFWQVQSQVILAGAIASLGDSERAYRLCRWTLDLARRLGDDWSIAYTLYWLGDILLLKTGDDAGAKALYEESLNLYEAQDDSWGQAEVCGHLGVVATLRNELDAAQSFFRESLIAMQQMGDRWAVARGLAGYAEALTRAGVYRQAALRWSESVKIWKALGNDPGLTLCLAGFMNLASSQGRHERAARLAGAVGQPFRLVGILLVPMDQAAWERQLAPSRDQLGKDDWKRAFDEGRRTNLDTAIDSAIKAMTG